MASVYAALAARWALLYASAVSTAFSCQLSWRCVARHMRSPMGTESLSLDAMWEALPPSGTLDAKDLEGVGAYEPPAPAPLT